MTQTTDATPAAAPRTFRFFRAEAAESMRPAHERGSKRAQIMSSIQRSPKA